MMRPSRSASRDTRSASWRITTSSPPAAMVSARSASAPIGVFSSWLTLATKSRRTLSLRRVSETSRMNTTAPRIIPLAMSGCDRSESTSRGRAEELQLPLTALALARPVEQLVDLLLGERIAVPAVAEPLGGVVAQQLVAVGVHDDDRIAAGARSASASWSRSAVEPVRAAVRRCAAGRRHRHCACASSSEPTGDVALGARVRRVGEDLLGRVVLDEARRSGCRRRAPRQSGTRCDPTTRAACCMLWVTMTIV